MSEGVTEQSVSEGVTTRVKARVGEGMTER